MTRHILLPGAGTGACNNLIRSLWDDYPGIIVVGAHVDRFTLRNSKAHRNYLLPTPDHPRFADALRRIVEREQIDLLMPITESDVRLVADLRDVLPCRTFLPSTSVIARCRDRYELSAYLADRGVPVAPAEAIRDLASLEDVFSRFARPRRLVCRMRRGHAACSAAPVDTPEDARAWIGYAERVHGVPASAFMLTEPLPGRDFTCQSLWNDGRVVLIKTIERFTADASALASVARTVDEPRVVEVCLQAIRALDPHARGAFAVDLEENRAGVPCVTEVNAGGFSAMSSLFDFTGAHSMCATYVRLALGERVEIAAPYDVADECYCVRGVDAVPAIFRAEALSEGIGDLDDWASDPAVHRPTLASAL